MKRSSSNSAPTLDNPLFIAWLFGDVERMDMLREGLTSLGSCTNIVLTNGYAQNATRVLQNIGLAKYFKAVCDTRGGIVLRPSSADAEMMEIEDGDRYSKEHFMDTYVFNPEVSNELYQMDYIDHVVYVDDDPEAGLWGRADVDVIELPKEGRSLQAADMAQASQLVEAAKRDKGRKQVVCVFDFDCTLSMMHMFKAMHQKQSRWRKGWTTWTENRAKKLRAEGAVQSPGAAPGSPQSITSPGEIEEHIEEKPPGLEQIEDQIEEQIEEHIEEKPPGLEATLS